MTALNRERMDWMEEWDQEELSVATQLLNLKAGDAYFMMEELPEKTAEYLIEVLMQRKMIGPTMVMYLDEEDMDDDYYRNDRHPVYGYCRQLEGGMNIICLYKHDLLVLAHELTHAWIHHKNVQQEEPHDQVFWVLHMMMNDTLMDIMGRE